MPTSTKDRIGAASRDAELVAAGRAWIADCTWGDLEPDDIDELSAYQVARGIAAHYAGGLAAFEQSLDR